MCGRFALGKIDPESMGEWLTLIDDLDEFEPRWNIAPTTQILIVREDRKSAMARWGLIPQWWSKPLEMMKATTFNARSEEAANKPFFRDAWAGKGRSGRCLIPAIGYYEWSGTKGAKTPWFVTTHRNRPGFCMAGLWAETRAGGAPLLTTTILTAAAGAATKHLHPRTPVILEDSEWDDWLSGTRSTELMRAPEDERIDVWEVGPEVGNVRNEGPGLIDRAGLF
ncbi:MAG: SOS response-associated peptidase [Pseudomonadota bacterium]